MKLACTATRMSHRLVVCAHPFVLSVIAVVIQARETGLAQPRRATLQAIILDSYHDCKEEALHQSSFARDVHAHTLLFRRKLGCRGQLRANRSVHRWPCGWPCCVGCSPLLVSHCAGSESNSSYLTMSTEVEEHKLVRAPQYPQGCAYVGTSVTLFGAQPYLNLAFRSCALAGVLEGGGYAAPWDWSDRGKDSVQQLCRGARV